ncbi:MAG: ketose-bisphosphate aldolase [Psychroserpens sp.]|jgi:ketose-bisphosphate aldolase
MNSYKKLKTVLNDLRVNKKSLLAFNLQNFYQFEAAQTASENLKLPLIIQFSERYLKFLDQKYGLDYIMNRYSNKYIYFHLDHCKDLELIKFCIESGFDSVMYDGSSEPLENNIHNTKQVMEWAHHVGCLVEGELGEVAGVEDGFGHEGSSYAELEEVVKYQKETNIDLLALGIGNAHGFYSDLDQIDMSILKETSAILKDQFFVLHGGTGLTDEIIDQAINYGVIKINVSTQIKKTSTELIVDYLDSNELYNEIKYHQSQVDGLSQLFESFIIKYTR